MFMAPGDPIFRALLECRGRRVRSRIITEIEKENIEQCKELMKAFELHHLDDVKGNFSIGDGIYRASPRLMQSSYFLIKSFTCLLCLRFSNFKIFLM